MSEPRDYEIIWSDFAVEDVDQLTLSIAQTNPEYAYQLWQELLKVINHLSVVPLRCRIVPELKDMGIEFYREMAVDPYRILIRIQETSVWILGVFDARRDLEDVLLLRVKLNAS